MYTQKARKAFTPGWETTMDTEHALPIKKGNQVIPVMRKAKRKVVSDEDLNERIVADDDELEVDDGDQPKKDKVITHTDKKVDLEIDLSAKTPAQQLAMKQLIAEMCMAITANPEESVLKKGSKSTSTTKIASANPDFVTYSMKDLLAFTSTKDPVELELVMLSITLVFKDICPGYRIRSAVEASKDENGEFIQLKKETKRLFDFERNLLHLYQQFLFTLEKRAAWGLSYLSKGSNVDSGLAPAYRAVKQSLGLTALRCQCELLKSLVHFNFRSMLLSAVISRASMMAARVAEESEQMAAAQADVINVVAEALEFIIRHDSTGDVSYELIMLMNKFLKATKTAMAPRILQCLESVKVTVKADDAQLLKFRAKNEKKRRKKDESKVEVGLIEANLVSDDVSKKRFQVNSLQEMSLLYFRILKMKSSEPNQRILLPMALAGLGRITHLINVDHVVDLMTILRSILDQGPVTSIAVRLLCIVCALKTLSGPGEVLQIDDEPYLRHLHQVMMDLPKVFDDWVSLYDCIDVYFVERREEKMPLVEKTILLLVILATSHVDTLIGSVLLTMAHSILLRYPRARQSMALWQYGALLLGNATGPADILSGKLKVKIIESSAAAMAALLATNKRAAYASTVTQGDEGGDGDDHDEEKFFEEDGRMEDLAMRGLVDGAVHTGNKLQQKKVSGKSAKVKKTKLQKKFSQRAHSDDEAIANMYSTWESLEGMDIREQMVRLLSMILVRSDARGEQPRFRRIVNAMCQQDLVPLPLARDDLDGSYDEIVQRGLKYTQQQQAIAASQQKKNAKNAVADGLTNNNKNQKPTVAAAKIEQTHSRRVVSFVDEKDEDEEDDDEEEEDRADHSHEKRAPHGHNKFNNQQQQQQQRRDHNQQKGSAFSKKNDRSGGSGDYRNKDKNHRPNGGGGGRGDRAGGKPSFGGSSSSNRHGNSNSSSNKSGQKHHQSAGGKAGKSFGKRR